MRATQIDMLQEIERALGTDEVEERYSAECNKQLKTVINGILSGLEGLFQDQWALCTAVWLVVVMVDRLQCDGLSFLALLVSASPRSPKVGITARAIEP